MPDNGFHNTYVHPSVINAVNRLVQNAGPTLSRSSFTDKTLDPRRSINDECGYKETANITRDDYRELYDRESVATRVVQVLPMECWKVVPTIFETEDVGNVTEFEKAWEELASSLLNDSKFIGEQGSPIWEHLYRADVLSGIGSYGILLLGLDDGEKDLSQEVKNRDGLKLLFLRTFDESLAQITQYEEDPSNPRYGQPNVYRITFNSPDGQGLGAQGVPITDMDVHHTRVIHLADNLGSSEIFGVPRMQPVYNRLLDLRKLYGGSAEMYWKGAFPGISFESHPQLGGEVTIDKAALKRQIEDYQNTLQRYLATTGMHANLLAPNVTDPTPQINVQIEAICIVLGIPKRKFLGSERGELSSTQDEGDWNDSIRYRQNRYLTPRVIVKLVDRLIELGILPEPKEYDVKWPELDTLSEQEQATVAVVKTDAMSKYVAGNVEAIMVPVDYFTKILGMEDDEAIAVVDEASKAVEEEELEMEKTMEDGGFVPAAEEGFERSLEDETKRQKALAPEPIVGKQKF